ncbi:META domain-containing protein [Thalassotalea euphylliae]|uniref:META domain-containing protein n=1 Tax=Thalassotalea euphylliae TaxID=1655234 RepID=UPI0036434B98
MKLIASVVLVCTALAISACKTTRTVEEVAQEKAMETKPSSLDVLVFLKWKLQSLNGSNEVKGAGGKTPYLTFDKATKKINGFAGCNNYFASYTADENNVSFSQLAMTRKFCQSGMELEASFAKTMAEVKSYKIDYAKLFLLNEDGNTVAEFIRD